MRHVKTTMFIAVVAWVAGCAHQAPVAEIQLFRQASTNVQTASQPLFDDLAVAERRQGQGVAKNWAKDNMAFDTDSSTGDAPDGGKLLALSDFKCEAGSWISVDKNDREIGFINAFCIEDAAYFSDLGDPPATHAFRSSLVVLDKYSEVLLILAEGKNIEAAKAQIQGIGTSVAVAVSLVPGAQAAAATVAPFLTALGPVVEAAAEAGNYKELKRLVTEAAPHFSDLVLALQIACKEMFETLNESAVFPITEGDFDDDPQMVKRLVDQIEVYRIILSDFVLLLNELDGAHKYIVGALENGKDQPKTMASLAERAQSLTIKADALRQAYVILRRGEVQ